MLGGHHGRVRRLGGRATAMLHHGRHLWSLAGLLIRREEDRGGRVLDGGAVVEGAHIVRRRS